MKHNKIKNWIFLAVISLAVLLPVTGQAETLVTWTPQQFSVAANGLRGESAE